MTDYASIAVIVLRLRKFDRRCYRTEYPTLFDKIPYDPYKDFEPVTLAVASAGMLTVDRQRSGDAQRADNLASKAILGESSFSSVLSRSRSRLSRNQRVESGFADHGVDALVLIHKLCDSDIASQTHQRIRVLAAKSRLFAE
jgi:hypothetical protein